MSAGKITQLTDHMTTYLPGYDSPPQSEKSVDEEGLGDKTTRGCPITSDVYIYSIHHSCEIAKLQFHC